MNPLTCDCGNGEFFKFGPYSAWEVAEHVGLKMIYTCTKCGEQLRLYQTSDAYRAARAAAPAVQQ